NLRVLAHLKVEQALEPQEQHHQCYDRGEDWAPDEKGGNVHCALPSAGAGCTLLLMRTCAPLLSLFWPAFTTMSPTLSPLVISTIPRSRRPSGTKICSTV